MTDYPHVGQRVICIDNGSAEQHLTVGARYTIREVDWNRYAYIPSRGPTWSPHGIHLCEETAHGISFYASRFRPEEGDERRVATVREIMRNALEPTRTLEPV